MIQANRIGLKQQNRPYLVDRGIYDGFVVLKPQTHDKFFLSPKYGTLVLFGMTSSLGSGNQ